MIVKAIFNQVYEKHCEFRPDIAIGAIHCVGHSDGKTKPCRHYKTHTAVDGITKSVNCRLEHRPNHRQLKMIF
jgi:hypothetical protein